MDDREVMVITGVYIALIIIITAVLLLGGAYIEAHIMNWDISLVLSKEKNPGEQTCGPPLFQKFKETPEWLAEPTYRLRHFI